MHLLVIGNLHVANDADNLRAEWRQVSVNVGVVDDLFRSCSFPRVPIPCERDDQSSDQQYDQDGGRHDRRAAATGGASAGCGAGPGDGVPGAAMDVLLFTHPPLGSKRGRLTFQVRARDNPFDCERIWPGEPRLPFCYS
jgi:hypothetical protein